VFGYDDGVTDPADLVEFARRHVSEGEAEELVVWIARRVGRPQALAGDRPTIERLGHVVAHWLSAEQRGALLAWLGRRDAAGRPLVPPAVPRAERPGPGTAPTP
jgi:hypothetical protein